MKCCTILYVIMLTLTMLFGCKPDKSFISLNNQDFADSITSSNVILVDVRSSAEFEVGHIDGAINIDVTDNSFLNKINNLDKSKTIAVYCRSGKRSKRAAEILVNAGYHVIELDKGFSQWNKH